MKKAISKVYIDFSGRLVYPKRILSTVFEINGLLVDDFGVIHFRYSGDRYDYKWFSTN